MLLVVVVLFLVSWLPLQTFSMITFLYPEIREGFEYQSNAYNIFIATYFGSHWLSMAHSCLNPLIYCFMNDKFRSDLHLLICGNRRQQSSFDNYSTTTRANPQQSQHSTSIQNRADKIITVNRAHSNHQIENHFAITQLDGSQLKIVTDIETNKTNGGTKIVEFVSQKQYEHDVSSTEPRRLANSDGSTSDINATLANDDGRPNNQLNHRNDNKTNDIPTSVRPDKELVFGKMFKHQLRDKNSDNYSVRASNKTMARIDFETLAEANEEEEEDDDDDNCDLDDWRQSSDIANV